MSTTLSKPAEKIMRLLKDTEKPLSAYDILAKLRRQGLRSPPTVYRALNLLGKRGLVHKIETLNAFVACRKPESRRPKVGHTSAFAICTSCNAISEYDDPVLDIAMTKVKQALLANVDKRSIEILGLCKACLAKKKKEGTNKCFS